MKLTDITPAIALTPLDGRYHKQTAPLVEYLSEPALNRERMRVEVEWMILLANGFDGNGNQPIVEGVEPFTDAEIAFLRAIPEDFGAEGIKQHAAHEAVTHHDVKAVEYYIDDQLDKAPAELTHINDALKTLVHFACTSEDINNLSTARCVKNAMEQVWTPAFKEIIDHLAAKAEEYKDKALLSLTHGQPATPTTLGKELAVYVYRLNRQLKHNFEISCSLLDTLSATLVESRWQRDLTDSTTQRNIGSALGYSQLALYNLMGGLKSIHPNDIVIERELDSNWEVLGEPIQTAMRACELKGLPGMDKPYEKVKELMRGHEISKEAVERFIDQQSFDPATAARLKALTPATYTGVAGALVDFDR